CTPHCVKRTMGMCPTWSQGRSSPPPGGSTPSGPRRRNSFPWPRSQTQNRGNRAVVAAEHPPFLDHPADRHRPFSVENSVFLSAPLLLHMAHSHTTVHSRLPVPTLCVVLWCVPFWERARTH